MAATFDDILIDSGDLGKFQKRILLMIYLIIIPTCFTTYMPIFTLTVPDHRCALIGLPNDTFSVQNDDHLQMINASIPGYSNKDEEFEMCLVLVNTMDGYNTENSTTEPTSVAHTTNDKKKVAKTRPCQRWVFDKSQFDLSIIEELNLVCDLKVIRTYANMAMMAGKMISALMQGLLGDILGRKKTMLIFTVILTASSFANAFVFNIPSLIAFRFAAGLSTTSIYLSAYVMGLEFLSPTYRRLHAVICSLVWIFGGFILTGLAYFFRDFQTLSLVTAAPTVLFLSYIWLLPESPRWLLTQGRTEEAQSIVEKIYAVNGKSLDRAALDELFQTKTQSKVLD